ncbi:hypothetical protein J41TS12_17610 [Paenibacillus antibioticophila]|uniref:Uncharacterized protein n=1 Tax=Paenibacillus antibioticophila TaxID=1274374 RepID=A0A919XU11_9BACL|nr:hypothetical protein [Paenibacillus antibioticophila]GIO36900.1 hypothetical protein J41TS12_17610 [Paenibacillus antibioticophila]
MKFPRHTQDGTGWVISTKYLKKIADQLEKQGQEGELSDTEPSLEQIEMVLLIVEELLPDPIPLPTIKPGDRVYHERFEALVSHKTQIVKE